MGDMRVICVKYIVTMMSEPIVDGALVFDEKIIDIGSRNTILEKYKTYPIIDLQNHVLMPALINAHTHIALTNARGFMPNKEFLDWLIALIPWMRKQSDESFFESSMNGIREMFRAGITTIGDSFFNFEPMHAALKNDFRCVYFYEVFGVSALFQFTAVNKYRRALFKGSRMQSNKTRLGISPHAPYTVTQQVLKFASEFSRQKNLRVSMHVAETAGEIEFLHSTKGRFRRQFEPSGRRIPVTNLSPLEYIDSFGLLNDRFIAVHGVHLTDSEFVLLAGRGGHLASCPSSNRNLKTGQLDLNKPINAGINICIGTDSPASCDSIDLFSELRFALRIENRDEINIKPFDALSMITGNPARALGFADEVGTIEIGKSSDIIALKPPQDSRGWGNNVEEIILRNSKADDVDLTIASGKIRHSRIDDIPAA
jgi:5-methylthioadenosine/S-adenosylhomocysteine deaminase